MLSIHHLFPHVTSSVSSSRHHEPLQRVYDVLNVSTTSSSIPTSLCRVLNTPTSRARATTPSLFTTKTEQRSQRRQSSPIDLIRVHIILLHHETLPNHPVDAADAVLPLTSCCCPQSASNRLQRQARAQDDSHNEHHQLSSAQRLHEHPVDSNALDETLQHPSNAAAVCKQTSKDREVNFSA